MGGGSPRLRARSLTNVSDPFFPNEFLATTMRMLRCCYRLEVPDRTSLAWNNLLRIHNAMVSLSRSNQKIAKNKANPCRRTRSYDPINGLHVSQWNMRIWAS